MGIAPLNVFVRWCKRPIEWICALLDAVDERSIDVAKVADGNHKQRVNNTAVENELVGTNTSVLAVNWVFLRERTS